MATNQEPTTEIDLSLVPVLLEYTGEAGHYTENVNGRTYSFSTAPMYRGVVVQQEDVPELMNRGKFKVLSEWYKPTAKVLHQQQVAEESAPKEKPKADAGNK